MQTELPNFPRLTSLTLDLAKTKLLDANSFNNLLGDGGPRLRKLKLSGLDLSNTNVLSAFGCLAKHKTLEVLDLNLLFSDKKEELKIDFDETAINLTLKKLKVRVAKKGHKKYVLPPSWMHFIRMFRNLKQLVFSSVTFPNFMIDLLSCPLPLQSLHLT